MKRDQARVLSHLRRTQGGFTLIELLITSAILGIFAVLVAPSVNMLGALTTANNNQKQLVNNRLVGTALLLWAKNNTALGKLPAPYSGAGYNSTIYNPGDTSATGLALQQFLQQQGLGLSEVNDDNFAAHRVRVFQKVAGLTESIPIYVQSGPLVTLTYDFGVIYQTACAINSSCNTATIPGDSAALSSSNYTTWSVSGTDMSPAFVSTLPLQEAMLDLTVQRLNTIRDKTVVYYNAQRLGAAPNDTTNWFPAPTGSGTANLSGASAATNQFCYDGWYQLNAANVNILPQVGLGQSEFSVTAWGGRIEYCRDYDLTLAGAGVAPHYAAVRINQSVSTGSAPDSSVAGNNVFISF
ncbi:type II secretion system protein [Candidatus Methylospira mobilis]|uniref:type II secretion system protein n=1 Tax=Candidatus Methylospira mobilis TaxID=1808979 RepID=UPI0028E76892|nr:type II secretion system protein [Candidatus Methylospira mobilis]WNV05864.1 type II secretion system protein [Candidatus Methylospira mobilis]